MISTELMELGETIHGSQKEKEILEYLENSLKFQSRRVEVNTKEWVFNYSVRIGGKEVNSSLAPYTKGHAKGKVGREILAFPFPDHPFKVKDFYTYAIQQGAEGIIFYEEGKTRRIIMPDSKIPVVFLPFKPEGEVEINAESYLKDTTSYNLEFTVNEGEDYILLGAHVDHWLSGFHDNLFSIDVAINSLQELKSHGLKLVFFSSEEGPRCCTGSMQYPKDGVFSAVIFDALYPSRVVYSSTPDLWDFAGLFPLKRIEMPTPFSDSFSFIQKGIPSLVLYNDDLIPYYHSNVDLPDQRDEEYLRMLTASVKSLLSALDKLSRKDLDEKMMKFGKRKFSVDYVNLTTSFTS
ncbi:Zn-dependent exopeptidase M28 [Acidianus sp. HS-5]|uniref:Zn-dependent exopeptidase M28 n=1 Tax=Acidianus sp. HS-5 TaxID=2886040 RepID=UPI001F1F3ACD|nr:Zn-dependent exopeptidase M28 [Acidianus sp. HS-5]BDC17302.1 Zn-dependent exopeptidase M28 [Acidianus sp. HS-5]